MPAIVYALTEPDTGDIRYIGKTASMTADQRYRQHVQLSAKARTHCANWIRGLLRAGRQPGLKVLEECDGDGCAEEIRHIELAKQAGARLTNHTDGGEGTLGMKHSDESREKRRQKQLGRKHTPEVLARLSASLKASEAAKQWREHLATSPEVSAKRSAAFKRMNWPPQHSREAWLKALNTPEARAKVRQWRKDHPEAVREYAKKIAAALTGRKQSPELIEKRIAPLRGRPQSPDLIERRIGPLRGRKRPIEVREKMKATWARKKLEKLQAQSLCCAPSML